MKNSIIICVKGGLVQDLEASENMNICIVDFDTEGSADEELGRVFYKNGNIKEANIHFQKTKQITIEKIKQSNEIEIGFEENNKQCSIDDDWLETYFEIVSAITFQLNIDHIQTPLIKNKQEANGVGGLYELAKTLTHGFQNLNKNRIWDGDFTDELDVYLDKKFAQDWIE
jgi:hypothetical protein